MYVTRNQILYATFFLCACIQLIRNVEEHMDLNYRIIPILSVKENVVLPEVALCLPHFIDEVKFAKMFPEIAFEIGDLAKLRIRSFRRTLYKRLTLKQLYEVSYSVNDFLDSCMVFDNSMNQINCTRLSPMVEWISFEEKCFQFFAFRGQFHDRFIYNRDLLVDNEWITFTLKREPIYRTDIGILVSSPFEILQPFSYNTGYIQISTTFLSTLFIIIEKFQIISLPAPFPSNCYNYSGHIMSQMHCVFDCFYHLFKPQGLYPDQMLTRYPEDLYGINLDKVNRSICTNKCKKRDCVIDKFELRVSYKKLAIHKPKIKLVLKSSFSEERKLLFQSSSRNRNILSIISFVLSPLAFFCGISMFTIQLYFLNMITYLIAAFFKIKKLLFQKSKPTEFSTNRSLDENSSIERASRLY